MKRRGFLFGLGATLAVASAPNLMPVSSKLSLPARFDRIVIDPLGGSLNIGDVITGEGIADGVIVTRSAPSWQYVHEALFAGMREHFEELYLNGIAGYDNAGLLDPFAE